MEPHLLAQTALHQIHPANTIKKPVGGLAALVKHHNMLGVSISIVVVLGLTSNLSTNVNRLQRSRTGGCQSYSDLVRGVPKPVCHHKAAVSAPTACKLRIAGQDRM